jgi:phosphate transport system ATP-binding protein
MSGETVVPEAVAHETGGEAKTATRSKADSVPAPSTAVDRATAKLDLRDLSISYDGIPAVRSANLAIPEHQIYAFIGPAGSGKTSVLRSITLLATDIDRAEVTGEIRFDGQNLLKASLNARAEIRRKIGMVFATPQPLPRSIFENLVFGPRLARRRSRAELDELVESSLRAAQLWDEVKDRLNRSALALSGGQQQRLCIARAIALEPEVILLDEPCSGLDPISTLKIEQMMESLKQRFTWVIVTNNTKQAARVSDRTAFFLLGDLVEDAPTEQMFTAPADERTGDYLEGRFG